MKTRRFMQGPIHGPHPTFKDILVQNQNLSMQLKTQTHFPYRRGNLRDPGKPFYPVRDNASTQPYKKAEVQKIFNSSTVKCEQPEAYFTRCDLKEKSSLLRPFHRCHSIKFVVWFIQIVYHDSGVIEMPALLICVGPNIDDAFSFLHEAQTIPRCQNEKIY